MTPILIAVSALLAIPVIILCLPSQAFGPPFRNPPPFGAECWPKGRETLTLEQAKERLAEYDRSEQLKADQSAKSATRYREILEALK